MEWARILAYITGTVDRAFVDSFFDSHLSGTAGAPLPAISCLGAFRTPTAAARG